MKKGERTARPALPSATATCASQIRTSASHGDANVLLWRTKRAVVGRTVRALIPGQPRVGGCARRVA
jgi:hypothetical protein